MLKPRLLRAFQPCGVSTNLDKLIKRKRQITICKEFPQKSTQKQEKLWHK
jgi:hypothetical protein